jgi:hypothetical protein
MPPAFEIDGAREAAAAIMAVPKATIGKTPPVAA